MCYFRDCSIERQCRALCLNGMDKESIIKNKKNDMKKLLGLLIAIIIVQNTFSQNITLDCTCFYFGDYFSDVPDDCPAKLTFSPLSGGGWKLDLKITGVKGFSDFRPDDIKEGEIQFPIGGTEVDISEEELTLSNDKHQRITIRLVTSIIHSYIGVYIFQRDDEIVISEPPYKEANIIDGFHKLVATILRPYTIKSATCDYSILGLINNPLGIEWGDSWRTPFDDFIPAAEYFYGHMNNWLTFFPKDNPVDVCGQKINSIELEYGYLHPDQRVNREDDTKYIKSTEYSVFLHTPKEFKKSSSAKKEECVWDKEHALEYYNKIKHELDLLGCNMQKLKSWKICEYRGMKNGKVITLGINKITDKFTVFFCVSLTIAHQTKDYDFYIVWD